MYGNTPGLGGGAGLVPTTAGIAVLPNTGGNHLLFIVSLLSTVIGSLILASTFASFVAKKVYKA